MNSLPLLIFALDTARFGVDARRVRESIWLPELTPVEEMPPWIVGVFGLRGAIVPVIDLRLRFGHAPRPYRLDDRVVVLDGERLPVGMIVSDVIDVVELPGAAIQPPPQAAAHPAQHLVAGEARVGDDLVSVLDVARVTTIPDTVPFAAAGAAASPGGGQAPLPEAQFYSEGMDAARALFRARAAALRASVAEAAGDLLGLAVIELGGERFGIALASVREFCNVVQVSPIPCCPPHILGAINLRGDLVTLVDPRVALNLPPAALGKEGGGKAVIGSLGDQAVALAVDEVHDVVYLRPEALQAPPPALRERRGAEVAGVAPYAGGMMAVLDLAALLAREEWVVDETA